MEVTSTPLVPNSNLLAKVAMLIQKICEKLTETWVAVDFDPSLIVSLEHRYAEGTFFIRGGSAPLIHNYIKNA